MGSTKLSNLLNEFLVQWKELFDMIATAHSCPDQDFKREDENTFLTLKAQLAQKQAPLAQLLPKDLNLSQQIHEVLTQVVSLREIKEMSIPSYKKFEMGWHQIYLNLNSTFGILNANQPSRSSKNILLNPFFVLIILIAIILAGFYYINRYYDSTQLVEQHEVIDNQDNTNTNIDGKEDVE